MVKDGTMPGKHTYTFLQTFSDSAANWMYPLQAMQEGAATFGELEAELKRQLLANFTVGLDKTPTEKEQVYAALEFLIDKKSNSTVAKPHFLRMLGLIRQLPDAEKKLIFKFYQQSKTDESLLGKNLYRLAKYSAHIKSSDNKLSEEMQQRLLEFVLHPEKFTTEAELKGRGLVNAQDISPETIVDTKLDQATIMFLLQQLANLQQIFYPLSLLFRGCQCADEAEITENGQFNGDMLQQYLGDEDESGNYFLDRMRELYDQYRYEVIPHDVQMQTLLHFVNHWHNHELIPAIKVFVTDPNQNQAEHKRDVLLQVFHRMLRTDNLPCTLLLSGTNILYGHHLAKTSDLNEISSNELPATTKDFFNILLSSSEMTTIESLRDRFTNALAGIANNQRLASTEPLLDIGNSWIKYLSEAMLDTELPEGMQAYQPLMDTLYQSILNTTMKQWQKTVAETFPNPDTLSTSQRNDLAVLSLQELFLSRIEANAKMSQINDAIAWGTDIIEEQEEDYVARTPLHEKLMATEIHQYVQKAIKYPQYPNAQRIVSSGIVAAAMDNIPTLKHTLEFINRRNVLAFSKIKHEEMQPNFPKNTDPNHCMIANFHLSYASLLAHHDISPNVQFGPFVDVLENINDQIYNAHSAFEKHAGCTSEQRIFERDQQEADAMIRELTANLQKLCDRYINDYLRKNCPGLPRASSAPSVMQSSSPGKITENLAEIKTRLLSQQTFSEKLPRTIESFERSKVNDSKLIPLRKILASFKTLADIQSTLKKFKNMTPTSADGETLIKIRIQNGLLKQLPKKPTPTLVVVEDECAKKLSYSPPKNCAHTMRSTKPTSPYK